MAGLICAAIAASLACVLVDPLVWHGDPATTDTSCDPGCIPVGMSVVIAVVAAVDLAGLGVAIRFAAERGRPRQHDAYAA